jgi:hypothetical protein
MATIIEHANARSDAAYEAVLAEMREGRAAARRLGSGVVMRDVNGEWRPASRWRGSRMATEIEDRRLRLEWATRALPAPAPTGLDADRARRLRAAEAMVEPLAPSVGAMASRTYWLGFGPRR